MAVNSETEINLKTLQRVDSNIIEIIDNASQVAIYKYERELNKWEGTDIEGTLFLYKRSLYPFHGFIIVNRMSTTNFVEDITSDMEFLLQEPYFLYKKSCGEIIGSWFYEERDFRRITGKIQSIVLKQATPRRRQRCLSDSDSQLKKDDAIQDIMSMFSEAHTEYIKSGLNSVVPEKNIEENFNDLTTCCDKKINNKSMNTYGKKSSSPLHSSFEEKYPVSPRQCFLSTGSYDPTHSLSLNSNKILNELVNSSKEIIAPKSKKIHQKKAESRSLDSIQLFPFKVESSSAPSRLSPLFNHDEIVTPSLSSVPLNSHITNSVIPNVTQTISGDYVPKLKNGVNTKCDYISHSFGLKESLISHLEWDSDIMVKIHEAYVGSLKSLFTPKKI